MIKELLSKQHAYIDHFFENVDTARAEKIVQACLQCKGMLIFTGVGKSGIIAEKLAMTMISVGTRALFLPPMNARHGDLGVVTDRDMFICISKSGETQEIVDLLPSIKRRGTKTMAWTSSDHSRLEQLCDHSIYLPVTRELCPFDLAPTTSTAVQLIFGDIIAVALMEAKNFTLDQFALNHPGGNIGTQIALTVDEVMLTGDQLPICHKDDLLREAIVELTNKRCGCVLVTDDHGKMVGIFTDGDLRRNIQEGGVEIFDEKISTLMNRQFLWTSPDALGSKAMAMMQMNPEKRVLMLPVLNNESVAGLVCMHDLVHVGVKSALVN